MRTSVSAAAGLVAAMLVYACTTGENGDVPVCATIEPLRELVVVDPAIVDSQAAKNAADGELSFRRTITTITPPGTDPSAFAMSWLESFSTVQAHGVLRTGARPSFREKITCPWLRRTPANECNADCSSCAAKTLDLSLAPFRLIAAVNRIDIEDDAPSGEGRLVYAFTQGPGDDEASIAWRATVAFEFRHPTHDGRTIGYWARRWHELSEAPHDPATAAQKLSGLFTEIRDCTVPSCSLAQIRTNEIEFDWLWEQREYKLLDHALVMVPLDKTPRREFSGTEALATYIRGNREAIRRNSHEVPTSMVAYAVSPLSALDTWTVPGVDEETRSAFARRTCDGCHMTEEAAVDVNFHISPLRKGEASLSPYLAGTAEKPGELSNRGRKQLEALCTR